MKKTCTICKSELPLKSFNKRSCSKDGFQNACRECNKQASKKYYKENTVKHRKVMLEKNRGYIKRNFLFTDWVRSKFGCALCEESDSCCIDFHHFRDKKQAISIMAGSGVSIKTLIQEINKCVCVCSNCHRKIHAGKLSTDGLTAMSLQESDIKVTMQTLELKE